jgi:hypothetical protein
MMRLPFREPIRRVVPGFGGDDHAPLRRGTNRKLLLPIVMRERFESTVSDP